MVANYDDLDQLRQELVGLIDLLAREVAKVGKLEADVRELVLQVADLAATVHLTPRKQTPAGGCCTKRESAGVAPQL